MDNDIGKQGEEIACEYLERNGFKIVEKNYHFGHGEIDIIAYENDVLVFVEVKTRKSLLYGTPELAVTKAKQKQIKKIAEAYLFLKKINDTYCRMDVIAIVMVSKNNPLINHIRNAF